MADEVTDSEEQRSDSAEADFLDPDIPTEGLMGMVVRGSSFAGVGFVAAQLLTLGFYVALARLISPHDFGDFAAGSIVVSVGFLFTESGMLAALVQRRERLEEAASTAVLATIAGGLLFSLCALAAAPLVGLFFHSGRVGQIAAALSGVMLIRSVQVVPDALLQRRFSFLRRIVIEPAQVIALGVASVVAASNGLGPWSLVIGYYAAAVTEAVSSWALIRWRPQLRLASFAMWRELVSFGRRIVAVNLMTRIGDQIPTALLGRFVSQGSLGQYRYADRMASTPLGLILAAASYVVFPAFARISHDRKRFSDAFRTSLGWFSTLAMPLSMILVPLGVPLAVVMFGSQWEEAGKAAMTLAPYGVGATIVSLVSEAAKAAGTPRILIAIHAVTFGVATVAMVALLPLGLLGVTAGISVGLVVGAVYGLIRIGRILQVGLRSMLLQLWPSAVAALAMVAVLLPLDRLVLDPQSHPTVVALALLAVEGLIGLATYTAILIAVAPHTLTQLRSMAEAARRRKSTGASAEPGAETAVT